MQRLFVAFNHCRRKQPNQLADIPLLKEDEKYTHPEDRHETKANGYIIRL